MNLFNLKHFNNARKVEYGTKSQKEKWNYIHKLK